jgi:hypothetical protein
VEWLADGVDPEFETWYHKEKKKKEQSWRSLEAVIQGNIHKRSTYY